MGAWEDRVDLDHRVKHSYSFGYSLLLRNDMGRITIFKLSAWACFGWLGFHLPARLQVVLEQWAPITHLLKLLIRVLLAYLLFSELGITLVNAPESQFKY